MDAENLNDDIDKIFQIEIDGKIIRFPIEAIRIHTENQGMESERFFISIVTDNNELLALAARMPPIQNARIWILEKAISSSKHKEGWHLYFIPNGFCHIHGIKRRQFFVDCVPLENGDKLLSGFSENKINAEKLINDFNKAY